MTVQIDSQTDIEPLPVKKGSNLNLTALEIAPILRVARHHQDTQYEAAVDDNLSLKSDVTKYSHLVSKW